MKLEQKTILSGPGKTHFFSLDVNQAEYDTIRSETDDKLKRLDE